MIEELETMASSETSPSINSASTSDDSLKEAHLRFAEAQQAYITTYIQLADTKAAWAFAASAASVGFLITNSSTSPLLAADATLTVRALGGISLALLLCSAVAAFLGIAPRLGSTKSKDPFFFGTVADHEVPSRYVSEIGAYSDQHLVRARLYHNFDIARVCRTKYTRVKQSLWIGFIGVLVLGTALLLRATS